MKNGTRASAIVSLIVSVLMVLSGGVLAATLELETSKQWGGNVTFAYSVHAADLDGNNDIEIVTAGKNITSLGRSYAEIAIWSYDGVGNSITLDTTHKWDQGEGGTSANSVFAADVDDDANVEIVTVGYTTINGDVHNDIAIWSWSPIHHSVSLEAEVTASVNIEYNSVYAVDLDNDDYLEIIVGGVHLTSPEKSILEIFEWDETSLSLEDSWEPLGGQSGFYGVYAVDADDSGDVDILAAGYEHVLGFSNAYLAVFHLDSGAISLAGAEHELMSGSDRMEFLSVHAGNLDNDDDIEITICGYAERDTGADTSGYLAIWDWDGTDVGSEDDVLWPSVLANADGTRCESVYVEDVDDDSSDNEILTVGLDGDDDGELKVWWWDGSSFTELQNDWDDSHAFSVYADDVDSDNTVEILVAGHTDAQIPYSWAELRSYYWES